MDDKLLHNANAGVNNFPAPDVPVEEAWASMQQLMQQAAPTQDLQQVKPKFPVKSILFASVAVVLLTIAAYYFIGLTHKEQNVVTVISTGAQPQTDTLPGNVYCFADVHSVLEQNIQNSNIYQLMQGGVFFPGTEIQKTVQLQQGLLLIEAKHGGVFIQCDSISGITSVHVQSNKTTVQLPGQPSVLLNEGESIQYNGKTNQLSAKQKADANLYSYATLIFEFNDTPLDKAAAMLEKAYGVSINFSNEHLKRCSITTRLDNKTLQDALNIIGYTLNFDFAINQQYKTVYISGKGCE